MNLIIDASGAAEILLKKEKSKKFDKILQEAKIVFAHNIYISNYPMSFGNIPL